MSDFTANIKAILDKSQIPKQLDEIESMVKQKKFIIEVDMPSAKNISQVNSAFNDLMSLQKKINSTKIKIAGLDSNKDANQISNLGKELQRLTESYDNLFSRTKNKLTVGQFDALINSAKEASAKLAQLNAKAQDTKGVEKTERAFARLKDIVSQMGKIQLKIEGLDASKNANEIAQLVSQYQNLESQYNRLKASLNGKLDGIQTSQLNSMLQETQTQLAQLDAKAQDTKVKLAEAINVKISDGSLSASIAKITQEYEKLASTGHGKLSEVKADIESLNQLQSRMRTSNNVDEIISDYNKFDSTLQKVKNTLSVVSMESKMFASSLDVMKLDNDMASWLEKNSNAAKKYGDAVNNLRQELAALKSDAESKGLMGVPISDTNRIKQSFGEIKETARSEGLLAPSFLDGYKGLFENFKRFVGMYASFYMVVRGLKDMYQNVKNIDSAMVELKKVTDETDATYNKFLSGTNSKAQEIGTTISGLISSTAGFARAGFDFEESQKLAEIANIYAVVGDEVENVDTATQSIISTMKAFDIPVENAMSIVDKFNEIGNNFSISSGGIGEAVRRSAAAMHAANNTIDETIALTTAANTIYQDPESVGNALKVVSMRLRGAKTDLEKAGLETDGMASSVSKLREEMQTLTGIDIMKDGTTFKSTYEFLDELSKVWDTLEDVDRANVLEKIAGKLRGTIVEGLLQNFDIARDALETSLGSEGSAMREHEKWLNSIEAKQLQLKASWEGLSQDFLSAGFVKGAVDGLRSIVNLIDKLVNSIGGLGTVLSGLAAYGIFKKYLTSVEGLKALITLFGSIPAPALIAAGAIAAVAAAIYAVHKASYNNKYNWAEGISEQAEKTKSAFNEFKKISDLQKELSEIKLVIRSKDSTKEDLANAKDRLIEISTYLNQEYGLDVKADVSQLDEVLEKLREIKYLEAEGSQYTLGNELSGKKEKYENDKGNFETLKQDYEDASKKSKNYNLAEAEIDKINDRIDGNANFEEWADAINNVLDFYEIPEDEVNRLTSNNQNYPFNARFYAAKDKANKEAGTDIEGNTYDKFQKAKENIEAFESGVTQYVDNALTILSSKNGNEDEAIKQLSEAINEYGVSLDEVSIKATKAKMGLGDFSELSGDAEKVGQAVSTYQQVASKLGADNEQIVTGSALVANGFDSIEEAANAGDTAIQNVVNSLQEYGNQQGLFEGMDNSGIATKLNEMAYSLNLLPESKHIEITANGNIKVIDDLALKLEEVNKVGEVKLNITTDGDIEVVEAIDEKLRNLAESGQIDIEFNIDTGGFDINNLSGDKIGEITAEGKIIWEVENYGEVEGLKDDLEELNGKECFVTLSADQTPVSAAIGNAKFLIRDYDQTTGTAILYAENGSAIAMIDMTTQKITAIPDKTANVNANVRGTSDVQNLDNVIDNTNSKSVFVSATTSGLSALQSMKNLIDSIKSKTVSIITKVFKTDGNSVDGTAHADGTAFKSGSWGTKDSGMALGGELGQELLVRDGKFYTIGEQSAGFFSYRKGDIIFNAEQTRQIFEKGKITHGRRRGRALASGTIVSSGYDALHNYDNDTNLPSYLNRPLSDYEKVMLNRAGMENLENVREVEDVAEHLGGSLSRWEQQILDYVQEQEAVLEKMSVDAPLKQPYDAWNEFTQSEFSRIWASVHMNDWEYILKDKWKDYRSAVQDTDTDSAFEGALKKHQHLLKMDQETTQEYLDWLTAAYSKASESGKLSIDNLYKYEEEIYETQKALFNERIKDYEHIIDVWEKQGGREQDIIFLYRNMQEEAHAEAERYRELGLSEENDKIQELQKLWWDYEESIKDVYENICKDIDDAYDNILDSIEHKANLINTYIDRAEQKGLMDSTRYYTTLQKIERETLDELQNKRADMTNALNEALESGDITEYSDSWYELQHSIDEVTESIEESKNALIDYDNKMRDIAWGRFDYLQDRFSDFSDEADFLINLLGDDLYVNNSTQKAKQIEQIISDMQASSAKWAGASATYKQTLANSNSAKGRDIAALTGQDVYRDNDGVWWIGNQKLYEYRNGQLNSSGMAVMGLHGLKYNLYTEQALAYKNELSKIESELKETPYDTKLIERRKDLLELQRKSILAAQEEKEAVVDLAKNGFEAEKDSLKSVIDAYKNSLDSAKDLYDYQKKVKEQTKDIASIEKQLAAYENDMSEETKAKVQKLRNELEDAKNNLQETEYDRYISGQKDLIDSVYNEYEELINERLDGVDELFEDLIDRVNDNAGAINRTLSEEVSGVKTEISDEMKTVWNAQDGALDKYFGSGGIILDEITGYFQNTDESLTGINTSVSSIMADVNSILEIASTYAQAVTDVESTKNRMVQNSLDYWATSDSSKRSALASENETYGSALGYNKVNGLWYDSGGNLVYSVTDEDKVRAAIDKMKANSAAYGSASSSDKKRLANENVEYAEKIAAITGQKVYKDSDGVWWIGNKKLYEYKHGGMVNSTGFAWLDGTRDEPELVLDSQDTKNFIALRDTLSNLGDRGLLHGAGSYGMLGGVAELKKLTDISAMLATVRQPGGARSSGIGDIHINIPIEHVEDYNDFVSQLQKDKQFEKLIRSVSVDLLSDGNSLSKNKYKWS